MHFEFQRAAKAAKNHVVDFEIVFEEGILSGLRLVGGALWTGKNGEGELLVTLPSQKFLHEGKDRYFDLLRSTNKDPQAIREFKARVVAAFRAQL